jgi:hypothetical protein
MKRNQAPSQIMKNKVEGVALEDPTQIETQIDRRSSPRLIAKKKEAGELPSGIQLNNEDFDFNMDDTFESVNVIGSDFKFNDPNLRGEPRQGWEHILKAVVKDGEWVAVKAERPVVTLPELEDLTIFQSEWDDLHAIYVDSAKTYRTFKEMSDLNSENHQGTNGLLEACGCYNSTCFTNVAVSHHWCGFCGHRINGFCMHAFGVRWGVCRGCFIKHSPFPELRIKNRSATDMLSLSKAQSLTILATVPSKAKDMSSTVRSKAPSSTTPHVSKSSSSTSLAPVANVKSTAKKIFEVINRANDTLATKRKLDNESSDDSYPLGDDDLDIPVGKSAKRKKKGVPLKTGPSMQMKDVLARINHSSSDDHDDDDEEEEEEEEEEDDYTKDCRRELSAAAFRRVKLSVVATTVTKTAKSPTTKTAKSPKKKVPTTTRKIIPPVPRDPISSEEDENGSDDEDPDDGVDEPNQDLHVVDVDIEIPEPKLNAGIIVPPKLNQLVARGREELQFLSMQRDKNIQNSMWYLVCAVTYNDFKTGVADDEETGTSTVGATYSEKERYLIYERKFHEAIRSYPDTVCGGTLLEYFQRGINGNGEWPTSFLRYIDQKVSTTSTEKVIKAFKMMKKCPLTKEDARNLSKELIAKVIFGSYIDNCIKTMTAEATTFLNKHWPVEFKSGESPQGHLDAMRRWYWSSVEVKRKAFNAHRSAVRRKQAMGQVVSDEDSDRLMAAFLAKPCYNFKTGCYPDFWLVWFAHGPPACNQRPDFERNLYSFLCINKQTKKSTGTELLEEIALQNKTLRRLNKTTTNNITTPAINNSASHDDAGGTVTTLGANSVRRHFVEVVRRKEQAENSTSNTLQKMEEVILKQLNVLEKTAEHYEKDRTRYQEQLTLVYDDILSCRARLIKLYVELEEMFSDQYQAQVSVHTPDVII